MCCQVPQLNSNESIFQRTHISSQITHMRSTQKYGEKQSNYVHAMLVRSKRTNRSQQCINETWELSTRKVWRCFARATRAHTRGRLHRIRVQPDVNSPFTQLAEKRRRRLEVSNTMRVCASFIPHNNLTVSYSRIVLRLNIAAADRHGIEFGGPWRVLDRFSDRD